MMETLHDVVVTVECQDHDTDHKYDYYECSEVKLFGSWALLTPKTSTGLKRAALSAWRVVEIS